MSKAVHLDVTRETQILHIVMMSSGCTLQEEMQKAAFQALQLQKDAVHGYIRNQVCVDDRVKAILHLWRAVA